MKKLIVLFILIFGLAFTIDLLAKSNPVDDFVLDHKSIEGAFHLDLGTSFLKDDDGDSDLLERVEQVRIFSVKKKKGQVSQKEIKSLVKKLRKKGYEAYASFKDSSSQIELMALQKKGRITDWLMMVNGEESIFLLEIRGDFDFNDLEKISQKIDIDQAKYIKSS